MDRIPVGKPDLSGDEIDNLESKFRDILESGWLTSGKYVETFEENLKGYSRRDYAVATSSCTAALHAILLALDIRPGNEVILPSNTFAATANAVLHTGATPVFVDSLKDTFNIDPLAVLHNITPRTKAIIAVNVAGEPCELESLSTIAKENGIHLIQDAAHGLAEYRGRERMMSACAFGVASALSFSATKPVTSCEGGAVVTNSPLVAGRVRSIRNEGRSGSGPSDVLMLGHNFKMSDIHAAIGLSQLRRIGETYQHRRQIAEYYKENLPSWLIPQRQRHQGSLYAFICALGADAPVSRDSLRSILDHSGIETTILFKPLHKMPFFSAYAGEKSVPVAEWIGENTLALPIGNGITLEQAESVIRCLREDIPTGRASSSLSHGRFVPSSA